MSFINHTDFILEGLAVTVSFVSDPAISHGKFRFVNNSENHVRVIIKSLKLTIGDTQETISGFHIFNLSKEETIDVNSVEIEPKDSLLFTISFIKRLYNFRFGEKIDIRIEIDANGDTMEALSPVIMERRIPLDQK